MVAGYAAKELAGRGLKPGELVIISAENALPYERPPLSKGFLAGKDNETGIRINPAEFYRDHAIELILGEAVAGLDAGRRALKLQSGKEHFFDNLIVATGAAPRTLTIPGAQLSGIFYLRSLEDSKRIREHTARAKHAIVLGGGFIAMEVCAVLAQAGVETTMVLRGDRVMKSVFTPAMSRMFEQYFSGHGVGFLTQSEVKEARGEGAIASVLMSDGTVRSCDLLVAGIGVEPITQFLGGSGLKINNGIMVSEYLETNIPGAYAAGDVANYYDTLYGVRRRVEHWDNAVAQGQHCARALTGDRTPFIHVPYFFSDVFDLSYEYWGDSKGAEEVVQRGDPDSTSYSVWWLKHGLLAAAFAINRPDAERQAAPRWIESKKPITAYDIKGETWLTA